MINTDEIIKQAKEDLGDMYSSRDVVVGYFAMKLALVQHQHTILYNINTKDILDSIDQRLSKIESLLTNNLNDLK